APTIAISRSSARKLGRPKGAYLVRLGLAFGGEDGVVSYEATITDPRNLREVFKSGEATTGAVSVAARVRPTRRTRSLKINIEAADPVGNTARLARTLRI